MKARRSYTKRLRADAEEATRERIVSAMVALHELVGPARTTVSAIAQRAGVERLTVYRHFPDETSMIRACSAHWNAAHPFPSILEGGDDKPAAVFRRAIQRLYSWYRANAAMLTQVTRDAQHMPVVAAVFQPFESDLDGLASQLDHRWAHRNARRAATIRHALDFSTWRSLERITRTDRRAAAVAASWLEG